MKVRKMLVLRSCRKVGWLTRLVYNGYNGQQALLCHVRTYIGTCFLLVLLVPWSYVQRMTNRYVGDADKLKMEGDTEPVQ